MSNKSVISKGHRKAMRMIKAYLVEIGERFAMRALYDAVRDWDSQRGDIDLTGNTRTGFCAGVYYDGKLTRNPISVFEAEMSVQRPTFHFANVGDSGFVDYGSGEYIGGDDDPYVRQYNQSSGLQFQNTGDGYGYEVTSNWLRSHRPKGEGLVVVIANAVPYAEYLREARKLDILESSSQSSVIATNMINCFHEVKFSDYEKL